MDIFSDFILLCESVEEEEEEEEEEERKKG
jgi:hypothetical protein